MIKFKPIGRKRKFIREQKAEKIFDVMTENHVDVLQNIEFVLISSYRNNKDIDDKVVAAALKAAIQCSESDDELSNSLVKAIAQTRSMRKDVSNEIWTNGLKVVLESVYNHSEAQKGDTDYLDFASGFMP
jgi:hypothetical protein